MLIKINIGINLRLTILIQNFKYLFEGSFQEEIIKMAFIKILIKEETRFLDGKDKR